MFTDWLDLMLYALQGKDDPYLEIVDQYEDDRPEGERCIDLFKEALARLQEGMGETNMELLGGVYRAFGMNNEAFGQYFTPQNVCAMMAEMQLPEEVDPEREEPFRVLDPACGSGRLLVEAAKQIKGDAVFTGQDKDLACVKMTALNLCFFNVDGRVVYGDSLRMERRKVFETRYSPLGGSVRELDPNEFDDPEPAEPEEPVEPDSEYEREAGANAEKAVTLERFMGEAGG